MTIQPVSSIQPTPATQPVEGVVNKELMQQTTDQGHNSSEESHTADKEQELKMLGKKEDPLEATIAQLNQKLLGRDIKMQFRIHQRTGYTLVRLVDMQTGDIIKEIPPENMLNVIGKIWDDMGIAIDKKG